jgi:DNA replication protein DnaC
MSSIAERFGSLVIPQGLSKMSLEAFEVFPDVKEAVDRVERYISTLPERLSNGEGILLLGSVGTGKTRLAATIANATISRGHSAILVDVNSLLERIRNLWGDGARLQALQSAMVDVDLLILDDLGQEVTSPREIAYLFGWLNSRYNSRSSTIITSNLGLEELARRYTEAIFSRIRERCRPAILKGKDYRLRLRSDW